MFFSENSENFPSTDFWMFCNSSGIVSMCGPEAARFGIVPGESSLYDILVPGDRLTAEDSLNTYGTVSLCLRVSPKFGYAVAHITKTVLFSTDIIEVRLYKSKDVMSIPGSAEPSENITLADKADELINALSKSAIPAEISHRLTVLADDIKKLSCEKEFLLYHHREKGNDNAFDGAEVLLRIENSLLKLQSFPYRIRLGALPENPVFHGSVGDFVGICYIASTVASKMSQNGDCIISISAAADDSVLEISAKTDNSIPFVGRTFLMSALREMFPRCHTELMLLEELTSSDTMSFYFECDLSGKITFHFSFSAAYDPYRLKYRDFTSEADEAIALYSRHILTLSSDTEDQCKQ